MNWRPSLDHPDEFVAFGLAGRIYHVTSIDDYTDPDIPSTCALALVDGKPSATLADLSSARAYCAHLERERLHVGEVARP